MVGFTERARVWLLGFGLFAFLWGAKLAVLDRFGSDLPVWDQWDAEGDALFRPWLQGRLEAEHFFSPHNEHRIAATRVLALGLLVANGRWDARLECVVNAALHSALAVALFCWGRALLARRYAIAWLLAVALLAGAPIAWANVVNGFHSQQYLLLAFSLATLALLPTTRPWSAPWWLGVACAVAALFSMAAGVLAAAVAALAGLLGGGPRTAWRQHRATLVVCALVVGAGALLHVGVPTNDALQARSVGEYFAAFFRYLTWPYERLPAPRGLRMAVLPWLQWLPWAWLGVRVLRDGAASDPRERVVVAIGVWTLAQFAAAAYARGAHAPWPPSRYVDTIVIGTLVNALALLRLLVRPDGRGRARRGLALAGIAAGVFTAAGLTTHVLAHLTTELPAEHAARERQAAAVRDYLATGNAAQFVQREVPYPRAEVLLERLAHPEIRAILPAGVQPEPRTAPWLSRRAESMARGGSMMAGLGALLVAGGMVARPRSTPREDPRPPLPR